MASPKKAILVVVHFVHKAISEVMMVVILSDFDNGMVCLRYFQKKERRKRAIFFPTHTHVIYIT